MDPGARRTFSQTHDDFQAAESIQTTRARVTQILNLLLLAPDIQEALLFLPRTERGRDPFHLRQLQRLALVADWKEQRKLWQALLANKGSSQDR